MVIKFILSEIDFQQIYWIGLFTHQRKFRYVIVLISKLQFIDLSDFSGFYFSRNIKSLSFKYQSGLIDFQ